MGLCGGIGGLGARHQRLEVDGARGERSNGTNDDDGGPLAPALRQRLPERRQQRGGDDDGTRAAVRQHVCVVGGGQQRVDGDRDHPAVQRAQERHGPVDVVLCDEQQALLAAEAEGRQRRRKPAGARCKVGVGEAAIVVAIGDALAAARVELEQVRGEVERRGRRDCGSGGVAHSGTIMHIGTVA